MLITDDKLWPMARGCADGPETRECYFEPLTKCTLADANVNDQRKESIELVKNGDNYDRRTRMVLTSPTDIWFRQVKKKYSWTRIPGRDTDHSDMAIVASALAYYFRPKAWLKREINKRIRRSIPSDAGSNSEGKAMSFKLPISGSSTTCRFIVAIFLCCS